MMSGNGNDGAGAETPEVPVTKAQPVAPGKEVKYVAIPVPLINAVTALIGSEIAWARADNVMSQLKVSCINIDLGPKGVPLKE